MKHSRHHARGGFTIVEVIVAMGILMLGMTAVVGLLSFGTALARTGELRTIGASVVEAVIADLEERLFPLDESNPSFPVAGLPPEEIERKVPGRPEILYVARTTPNPDQLDLPGGPLEWRVDVELRWQAGGSTRKKQFSTLLLREVPFGERLRRQFVEGGTLTDQETP